MGQMNEYDYSDRITEIEKDMGLDLSRVEDWFREDLDELNSQHLGVMCMYYAVAVPFLIGVVGNVIEQNDRLTFILLQFSPIAIFALLYAIFRHIKYLNLKKFEKGEFDAFYGVCNHVEEVNYKYRKKMYQCTLPDKSSKTAFVSYIETNVRSGDEVIIFSTKFQDFIYRI